MFNKFLDNFQKFGHKINQLELNVSGERKKFMEVFERNLILEKEIAERTQELNQANKSILTLQHIWTTMNSKDPLAEVLKTIVNGLSDDVGYLHSFILQVINTDNGKVLKIRSTADNSFSDKLEAIFECPLTSFEIPISCESNILIKSLERKKIIKSKSLGILFEGVLPEVDRSKLEKLDKLLGNRSLSILPIIASEDTFGCLVAISIRKEMCDTEKNFLKLFAGQLELAVTITGLFETIREQAITDGLTGLYNRRYFDQCIANEAERALRLKQPFSLVTLDLDHLKIINDTYGHSAGDSAICTISDLLKKNARSIDIPARFGGEEFGIVLPGIDLDGGMIAAERLRVAIETTPVDGVGRVTASIGVATFLRHTDNVDDLLELVDQAMYKAKRNGRNQIQEAQKDDNLNWQQMALDTFIDILSKQKLPIDKKIAKKLNEKLNVLPAKENDVNELIYSVVDAVTQIYDPMSQIGRTKEKVFLAEKMAIESGLAKFEIDKIKMASLVYNIGNIMLPQNILLKPGPLNDDEKKIVAEHPIIAAKEILSPISSASNVVSLVEHHHESWDGSGYPYNISGESIPIGSRIIIIIDAYFALISEKPYRKALSRKEAIDILQEGANKKWDGKLVEIFVKLINTQVISA